MYIYTYMEIKTMQWVYINSPEVGAATVITIVTFLSLTRVLILYILEVMFGLTLLEPGYVILYQQESLMTKMEVIIFK